MLCWSTVRGPGHIFPVTEFIPQLFELSDRTVVGIITE
jgi:hypothetical protein